MDTTNDSTHNNTTEMLEQLGEMPEILPVLLEDEVMLSIMIANMEEPQPQFQCSICLSDIEMEDIVTCSPCGHKYCDVCLSSDFAIRKVNTCSCCRTPIESITSVYQDFPLAATSLMELLNGDNNIPNDNFDNNIPINNYIPIANNWAPIVNNIPIDNFDNNIPIDNNILIANSNIILINIFEHNIMLALRELLFHHFDNIVDGENEEAVNLPLFHYPNIEFPIHPDFVGHYDNNVDNDMPPLIDNGVLLFETEPQFQYYLNDILNQNNIVM